MLWQLRKGVVWDDTTGIVSCSKVIGKELAREDARERLIEIFLLHIDESLRCKNLPRVLNDVELNVPCEVKGGYRFKGRGILRKFHCICRMTIRGGAFEKWHALIYDGAEIHYSNSPNVSIRSELVLKKSQKRLKRMTLNDIIKLPFDNEESILKWVFQEPLMLVDYSGIKDKEFKRYQQRVMKKWIEKKSWIDTVFSHKTETERAIMLDHSLAIELGSDYKKYIIEDGQM